MDPVVDRSHSRQPSDHEPKKVALDTKPVQMKLFAAWEVDKTPSNCIPRLCTLKVTKLALLKPLAKVNSVVIAVKMQSLKRTLRSNEIRLSATDSQASEKPREVDLDLTFVLQYPHFLKREGNILQILLQRRKRYKNRAILGFKTLAHGIINMAQVLQKPNCTDKHLELIGSWKTDGKVKSEEVAKVLISSIKSQPVDQELGRTGAERIKLSVERSADVESDEEGDPEDFSPPDEGSDSEAIEDVATPHTGASVPAHTGSSARERLNQWRRQVSDPKTRKLFRIPQGSSDPNAHQRNLKQRFISLLKRFKNLPDSDESFDVEDRLRLEQELLAATGHDDTGGIDDLFEEEDLDEFSDSPQDDLSDDLSISSTPKPSLKPYFSSCSLVGPGAESQQGGNNRTDSATEQTPDTSDTSLKAAILEDKENKERENKEKEKEKDSKKEKKDKEDKKKSKLFTRDKKTEPHTPPPGKERDKK